MKDLKSFIHSFCKWIFEGLKYGRHHSTNWREVYGKKTPGRMGQQINKWAHTILGDNSAVEKNTVGRDIQGMLKGRITYFYRPVRKALILTRSRDAEEAAAVWKLFQAGAAALWQEWARCLSNIMEAGVAGLSETRPWGLSRMPLWEHWHLLLRNTRSHWRVLSGEMTSFIRITLNLRWRIDFQEQMWVLWGQLGGCCDDPGERSEIFNQFSDGIGEKWLDSEYILK